MTDARAALIWASLIFTFRMLTPVSVIPRRVAFVPSGLSGVGMLMMVTTSIEPELLKARVDRFRAVEGEIVAQVRRVIVGQDEVMLQPSQEGR